MKLSYLFISSVVALGSFTSCSDVLDVAPDGTLSMEEVYADPTVYLRKDMFTISLIP